MIDTNPRRVEGMRARGALKLFVIKINLHKDSPLFQQDAWTVLFTHFERLCIIRSCLVSPFLSSSRQCCPRVRWITRGLCCTAEPFQYSFYSSTVDADMAYLFRTKIGCELECCQGQSDPIYQYQRKKDKSLKLAMCPNTVPTPEICNHNCLDGCRGTLI